MSNLSNFVKRLRDIMRNDAGINGDAQRIEQIAWMLFLKVYDSMNMNGSYKMITISPSFRRNAAEEAGLKMTKPAKL